MNDKAKSIYFAIFAVLYFGFTVFIAGHGIHGLNSFIAFALLVLSGYYYLKDRRK